MVDPWGVNLVHDQWYLLRWSHTAGARRVLRPARGESHEATPECLEVPVGLDVESTVDQLRAGGGGHRMTVVLDAPLDDLAEACRRPGRVLLEAVPSVADEPGIPSRSD